MKILSIDTSTTSCSVAVVDAVMAQDPGFEDVLRRDEHHASDPFVQGAVGEKRAVGGVVAQYEHRRDDQPCEHPERDHEPPGGREEERRHRGEVEEQVPCDEEEASPKWPFPARVGDDVDDL